MDRVLALHAGSRGFDSHRGHMSEQFFRSNRPGYPHPVSSELEISGIRVAVGDCSVTERRRWRPPDQTGKTVYVHAKHYKHNEDGCTAPGVCGNGFVPLSHSGERRYENWNTHTRPCSANFSMILQSAILSIETLNFLRQILFPKSFNSVFEMLKLGDLKPLIFHLSAMEN